MALLCSKRGWVLDSMNCMTVARILGGGGGGGFEDSGGVQ